VSEDLKSKIARDKKLTSAQADRVLDKAADLMVQAEGMGHLSKADLKAGAAEVGIDPRYVEAALEAVQRDERDEKRAEARKKKRMVLAAVIVGTLCVLTIVVGRFSLGSKLAEVDKRRAQLDNVVDRKKALVPQLEKLAKASGDKTLLVRLTDEMAGAENRISVERKRYNEAAVEYNKAASTPPIGWLRPLTGMPSEVEVLRASD
jgi:hypothetical protein